MTPFTSELDLRRWTEQQLSSISTKFTKHEPGPNSDFGIPDYSLHFKDHTLWLELKMLKPKSKIFTTSVRANQKKKLKSLHKASNVSVGILACIQNTPAILAIRIRPSTVLGVYDILALISSSLACNVSCIQDALDFIYNDS